MKYDPQKIFNTANSFLTGAGRCSEPRPLGAGQYQMVLAPATVCTAFSVELFFKAILTLEGGEPRGHDLLALFRELTNQSQLALRKSLAADVSTFDAKLKENATVFEVWRYVHEKESAQVDLKFLTALAGAAKQLAQALLDTTK